MKWTSHVMQEKNKKIKIKMGKKMLVTVNKWQGKCM